MVILILLVAAYKDAGLKEPAGYCSLVCAGSAFYLAFHKLWSHEHLPFAARMPGVAKPRGYLY